MNLVAMEALTSSSAAMTSLSSCTIPNFSLSPSSARRTTLPSRTSGSIHFHLSCKRDENESSNYSQSESNEIIPILHNQSHLSLSPLSKDAAMGLVLSAAAGTGWTTCSGMEGPSAPVADLHNKNENISTFPWSLFTKSPRRRMLVAFTCKICGQRTTRAINPHAYTDGTVFVQCCGCNAFHKLVDNLNLFHEINCYVNKSFNYKGRGWDGVNFNYFEGDEGDDVFPTP